MDDVISSLRNLGTNLRPADLLDIGIVAVLVYLGLVWLRTRASRALFIGVLTVAGLYLLSRTLNLYLTSAIFRVGITAILLALILIFQEDIRDAFERIVSWRRPQAGRRESPASETVETLVAAVSVLAEERIGALIVLKRREHLSRHLQAGFRVDGAISVPLLRSIFDPHSPGHDGAVVIEGHQLRLFGAHLPLSRNLGQVGDGGTRHLAALGLAERSDALVLVVSEERGSISLARAGRIDTIASSAEVRRHLETFYEQPALPQTRPAWRDLLTRNLGLKFASLALAALLWLLFAYRVEQMQQTYAVPVEYRDLPPSLAINGSEPTTARVTLSGPERAFGVLDPGRLRIVVDLTDIEEGSHTIPLNDKNLRREAGLPLPVDLSVSEIDPPAIRLEAYRPEKQ